MEMKCLTQQITEVHMHAGFGRGGSWVLGDYYSGTSYTPDMYLACLY